MFRKKETRDTSRPASPFFKPSTPSVVRPVSTPGGTVRLEKSEDKEQKASLLGTAGNLMNAIVGAGIVGIAFAVKEAGLVAGFCMVILCAVITEKSLRLLVETAKHVDVPSYEVLAEAVFGRLGFVFVSVAMFIMAYGGMVSYLIIIKDTLPVLFGADPDNLPLKRAVLTVSSLLVILPLSCQRDMADLAKTSTISVIFDIILVFIIVIFSPAQQSISSSGGIKHVISHSTLNPSTFFVGLGVLSFAFVCQHSAFIIAGSLDRPTNVRWAKVTALALTTCCTLATCIGTVGYLAFRENTDGNVLNNFQSIEDISPLTKHAANVAQALLCTTMFFVYPMESFVARHVTVVTLFQGRRAHEGDDHAVLARTDRRVGLTVALYILALTPALLFEDLGSVLSVTGALGGSSLSYIGPGCVYIGVHGDVFLKLVEEAWGKNEGWSQEDMDDAATKSSLCGGILHTIAWYLFLMPLWCFIARIGQSMLQSFNEKEAQKSPHLNRLGKIKHNKPSMVNSFVQMQKMRKAHDRRNDNDDDDEEDAKPLLPKSGSLTKLSEASKIVAPKKITSEYGSTNRAIAAAIAAKAQDEEEDDPQEEDPSWKDFIVAMLFVVFGTIALVAGLVSVSMGS